MVGAMKADPAAYFGIGEDACLYGFVLAGGGHLRINPGDFHGSRGLYAQARAKLEQLVQVLGCQSSGGMIPMGLNQPGSCELAFYPGALRLYADLPISLSDPQLSRSLLNRSQSRSCQNQVS
jgi:hypothetical protein